LLDLTPGELALVLAAWQADHPLDTPRLCDKPRISMPDQGATVCRIKGRRDREQLAHHRDQSAAGRLAGRAQAAMDSSSRPGSMAQVGPNHQVTRRQETTMIGTWRGVALAASLPLMAALPAQAQDALGGGMTIYMQMGGNPGDGATLPRTNGARAAAAAFGVENLIEQYSGWLPEEMLNHFRAT
jgi:hypothetical protein